MFVLPKKRRPMSINSMAFAWNSTDCYDNGPFFSEECAHSFGDDRSEESFTSKNLR